MKKQIAKSELGDELRPEYDLKTLPDDVDFARYEREAFEILQEIGAV